MQLIIVNDGSTDNTAEIIGTYHDSRIIYIRNSTNLGLSASLNKGFAVSTGHYLTWTSDDNYYHENAIEQLINAIKRNNNVDFVYSNYFIIDQNDKVISTKNVGTPWKIIRHNCVGPCFLYSRQVYNHIGQYNEKVLLAEDYDYWLRVYKHYKMAKIEKNLYYYRLHPTSLTGQLGHDQAYQRAEKVRKSHVTIFDIFKYSILRTFERIKSLCKNPEKIIDRINLYKAKE